MTAYTVEADVGKVHATVEADSAEDAMLEAVDEWVATASDIFVAATFTVRETA